MVTDEHHFKNVDVSQGTYIIDISSTDRRYSKPHYHAIIVVETKKKWTTDGCIYK